jgi:SET domain-containing protein
MKSTPKFFINPKTEVRDSKIKGKGLFAKEKIRKGEIIHVAEGVILTLEESKKFTEEEQNICYDIDDNHLLCPKDFNNLSADWYINHSCNPNSGSAQGWFTLVAMRDIEPEEEITYDYAMTDSEPEWSMECHCGAKDCRKKITGNDWKIKEIQERYVGYFQENIQNKIDVLRNHILVSSN